MPHEQLDYVATRISLRAPRVAIVFDAGSERDTADNWIPVARAALARANEFWGGVGFVLVPHVDGMVSGELLRVLRAYDPDFVVPFERHAEHEIAVEARPPVRRSLATERAVEAVSLACSPHRRWQPLDRDPAHDPVQGEPGGGAKPAPVAALDTLPWFADAIGWDTARFDLGGSTSGHLTPISALPVESAMWLHAPSSLTGALGLALAARVGSVDDPPHAVGTVGRVLRPTRQLTPGLASTDADDIVGFLVGPEDEWTRLPSWLAHHPGGLELGVVAAGQPAAWTRTTTGLAHFVQSSPLREVRHVVVGDSADDFAVYLLLDRLYGNAVWLHADWGPLSGSGWSDAAARGLGRLLTRAGRGRGYEIVVSSTSVAADSLEALMVEHGPLYDRASEGWSGGNGEDAELTSQPRNRSRPRVRLARQVDLPERGRLHLGVVGEFEKRVFLPAHVSSTGCITLASPLDPISPSDPDLSRCAVLNWQVDVDLDRPSEESKPLRTPSGRGFDGHALVPTEDGRYETWVRTSRAGVTFDSRRYDFVPAGAIGNQRLARPRLQRLGLSAWIDALARQSGRRTEPSDAGARADLLADLWGGRASLAEAFSGSFHHLVGKFSQTGDSTREAYPANDGILLPGGIGVLKYAGLSAPWAELSSEEARRTLDDLVMRSIVRRGLVLRCGTCRNLGFTDIDALANTNRCARCGYATPLRLESWRQPVSDPEWHYELHPIVRDLVRENGHAPLWLAHHLRMSARYYCDVSETNLFVGESRQPIAEADLVAHVDGRLLTAEVKTTDELDSGTGKRRMAARKRVMWARLINADEIVLATTKSSWQQSSVDVMQNAMRAAAEEDVWLPGGAPTLRLVHGLGEKVTEQVLHPY